MIEIKGLCLKRGPRIMLENVNLNVHSGESVAIIGPSGVGKTSLIYLLLGLLDGFHEDHNTDLETWYWSGCARICGIDVLKANQRDWTMLRGKHIGFCPQGLGDALNPQLAIKHQFPRGVSLGTIQSLSNRVGLPNVLLTRLPKYLSGGEKQRALLAIALAKNPNVLFLDEPTSALDSTAKATVIKAINKGRQRRAQLLVTHDLETARRLADRVLHLSNGKLLDVPIKSNNKLFSIPITEVRPNDKKLSFHTNSLTIRHAGKTILSDVEFAVPRGHCAIITGSSGSGKTSLARTLAGLIPPSNGQIIWKATNQKPFVAFISQHPHQALAPHFTVRDVMQEPLRLLRKLRIDISFDDDIYKYLGWVGLPSNKNFCNQTAATLSGGEAQRLVIARALISHADLLIADEPTAALDEHNTLKVMKVFAQLISDGQITLVMMTHQNQSAVFPNCKHHVIKDKHIYRID